ncbi:FAD-linked oxidase [Achromobacter piechaudii]|uniref:FAD-binding oxidoreductase n=1 Tax=Achromobacter piechaudii TaxID=72556 RepID=UPI000681325B|nr:FAD-binding oxidoreductase [Achromobacter piechaudii]KNY11446.1 FAD-linked oxidase [Achromobacter piechaudii]CAB3830559.1 Decaprenylphosphoryl-beta-D-ribose oxidase [Achromobacter piechaudii]CAB3944112.1 Decaprenylphosphoryl-beta-D-ribose oxidase [Achromobacter piechaudii]
MVTVSSWGRLERRPHVVYDLSDRSRIAQQLRRSTPGIAFGMGRSYGDACLNPEGALWQMSGLDRFLSFDESTGRVYCEAGVLLRDIQQLAVPRGWMLPVTPGTQIVTVGGAIANEVHGKNHHVLGTFGHHVVRLVLQRTDGERIECSPQTNEDWFAATIGGLGLTGVILAAELQLRRVAGPWLVTETRAYHTLDEFFVLADGAEHDWEYTVAWIDCQSKEGKGLFMRGNHIDGGVRPDPAVRARKMPFTPPISLVNRLSLRPFNWAYFNLKKNAGREVVHYAPFFYPLDNLLEWNRMYGPTGFYQYQSVVPRSLGCDAIGAMLREISRSGEGSFLAVLKTFGSQPSVGMLGFPQPGVTLALDFQNKGPATHRLFSRLDSIVAEAGGRIYPAKDARMPRALFEAGYPALTKFLSYRDPGVSSALSRRLMGN